MQYIALLDCNNFFVSCERLFRPDLVRKPVAVLSSNDGCIVARSQEVKDMGIPMGLPLFQAKQLVDTSKITFFSSNFTLYRDISARVMSLLAEEVGKCDVYSVDEAFFMLEDPTEPQVASLRQRIMQKTGIPVSIGVAPTKTLAKCANRLAKKANGVTILELSAWPDRAVSVPAGDIWGLGRATAQKLTERDVKSAADFMAMERRLVRQLLGVAGERIYDELRGTRVYELGERHEDERQSVTSSRSFATATNTLTELQSAVAYHVAQASAKIRAEGLAATMMYLELRASRHGDFSHRSGGAAVPLPQPTNSVTELTKLALEAAAEVFDSEVPYKKAGVTLAGLIPETYVSASLFDAATSTEDTVSKLMDKVQKRFGFAALHSGAILPNRDRSSVKMRSKAYTTAWSDIPTVRAN